MVTIATNGLDSRWYPSCTYHTSPSNVSPQAGSKGEGGLCVGYVFLPVLSSLCGCLILSSLPVSRTGTPSALSSLVPSGHCRSTRFGMITAIVWLTRKLCRDTPLICGHSAGGPSAARLHFLTSYLQSSFSCLPTYSAIVLYGSISSRLIQT